MNGEQRKNEKGTIVKKWKGAGYWQGAESENL